ncbi:MAG: acetyltransferase [Desulfobulbaceae bacterium A2]|nr:MAG: acetyltransferase [Desulfobulbaceae bacterium A2]
MPQLDVFNGDADGLCALLQLRLHEPCPGAGLVTGVKRDIRLLDRLRETEHASITVLDISLDVNRKALLHLLDQDNSIIYLDHHFAGEVPQHPRLTLHLDPAAASCTSLIVDALLGGRYRPWALVGAFGDNLHERAQELAGSLPLTVEEIDRLRELGTLLNYNGYGEKIEDLHIDPAQLFQTMLPFANPLDFWAQAPIVPQLRQGHQDDLGRALALSPLFETPAVRAFQLPDTDWARRVGGSYAHHLAREQQDLAHAVLQPMRDGSWRVSVRAPRSRPAGADLLCRRYPTGGGRTAAAGINALPPALLPAFLQDFRRSFPHNA